MLDIIIILIFIGCLFVLWLYDSSRKKIATIAAFFIFTLIIPVAIHDFQSTGRYINIYTGKMFYPKEMDIISFVEINQDHIALWVMNELGYPEYLIVQWEVNLAKKLNQGQMAITKKGSAERMKLRMGKNSITTKTPVTSTYPTKPNSGR